MGSIPRWDFIPNLRYECILEDMQRDYFQKVSRSLNWELYRLQKQRINREDLTLAVSRSLYIEFPGYFTLIPQPSSVVEALRERGAIKMDGKGHLTFEQSVFGVPKEEKEAHRKLIEKLQFVDTPDTFLSLVKMNGVFFCLSRFVDWLQKREAFPKTKTDLEKIIEKDCKIGMSFRAESFVDQLIQQRIVFEHEDEIFLAKNGRLEKQLEKRSKIGKPKRRSVKSGTNPGMSSTDPDLCEEECSENSSSGGDIDDAGQTFTAQLHSGEGSGSAERPPEERSATKPTTAKKRQEKKKVDLSEERIEQVAESADSKFHAQWESKRTDFW